MGFFRGKNLAAICDVKVKLDNYQRREACEICGKSKEMSPVVVLPIYTLLSGNPGLKKSVSRSELYKWSTLRAYKKSILETNGRFRLQERD